MIDEPKKTKTRRSREETKAYLAAKIREIDQRQDVKDKQEAMKLAGGALALAKRRPQQPTLGQAATLLSQAAAAIQAQIPQ